MPECLEGTVDVPAVGKMKKAYIYVPAGLAAVYVAYRWYNARGSSDEQAPGADGMYTSDDLSEYGLSTSGGATTSRATPAASSRTGRTRTRSTTTPNGPARPWRS